MVLLVSPMVDLLEQRHIGGDFFARPALRLLVECATLGPLRLDDFKFAPMLSSIGERPIQAARTLLLRRLATCDTGQS